jgi:hypothetical protein
MARDSDARQDEKLEDKVQRAPIELAKIQAW